MEWCRGKASGWRRVEAALQRASAPGEGGTGRWERGARLGGGFVARATPARMWVSVSPPTDFLPLFSVCNLAHDNVHSMFLQHARLKLLLLLLNGSSYMAQIKNCMTALTNVLLIRTQMNIRTIFSRLFWDDSSRPQKYEKLFESNFTKRWCKWKHKNPIPIGQQVKMLLKTIVACKADDIIIFFNSISCCRPTHEKWKQCNQIWYSQDDSDNHQSPRCVLFIIKWVIFIKKRYIFQGLKFWNWFENKDGWRFIFFLDIRQTFQTLPPTSASASTADISHSVSRLMK